MWTNLSGLFSKGGKPAARTVRPRHSMSGPLTLMRLEEREVMSSSASLAAPAMGAALVAQVASQAPQIISPVFQQSSILPINITSVVATTVNNVTTLVANASIGNHTFQIPLDLTVPAGQNPLSTTQILQLHVGEIHLDLLGLKVDTSEICLNISAQTGSGNLLGNLLGGIAGALDSGIPLTQVLNGLGSNFGTVTTGLTALLNGALGQLTSLANAASGASVASVGNTSILHLEVAPLHLNLLGLQVDLDNCHNGPVTVDISAQSGPGKLLGNLLGGLSHLLDSNANATALLQKLDKIAGEIGHLV
jgi:hypothetical protein